MTRDASPSDEERARQAVDVLAAHRIPARFPLGELVVAALNARDPCAALRAYRSASGPGGFVDAAPPDPTRAAEHDAAVSDLWDTLNHLTEGLGCGSVLDPERRPPRLPCNHHTEDRSRWTDSRSRRP